MAAPDPPFLGLSLKPSLSPLCFHVSGSGIKDQVLSRVRLFATPQTVACQSPLFMGFSRQEYWSGLPFPSPGDVPDPGIEPWSPALQENSLPLSYREDLNCAHMFHKSTSIVNPVIHPENNHEEAVTRVLWSL